MPRQSVLHRLSRYQPLNAGDFEAWRRTVAFIKDTPECFERRCGAGHITASGWLVDPSFSRVLMTHHKKLGKWLQCGGHADGDPDLLGVAMRECREESGLHDIRALSEEIFDLDVHPIEPYQEIPAHLHYDIRFALQAFRDITPHSGSESIELAWVRLDELESFTKEESVLRMHTKWLNRK